MMRALSRLGTTIVFAAVAGCGGGGGASSQPSLLPSSSTVPAAATRSSQSLISVAGSGPTLAQAPVICSGSLTCSLAKPPADGDVLAVVPLDGAPDLGSIIVRDANGTELTRHVISPNCTPIGHCAAVFDEVVSGSPGSSVSLTSYNAYRVAVYDIAGANYPGVYSSESSTGRPPFLQTWISAVKTGDIELCGYIQPMNSPGNVLLKFSNATGTVMDSAGAQSALIHGWATTTGWANCTAGNVNPDNSAGIAYAAYAAAPARAPVTPPTASAAVPALAQSTAVCSGSESCSLAKAPAVGDVLSVLLLDGAADLGSVTVKDSLGRTLTREVISPNCASVGHCAAVYDETVTSGVGNTVSISSYDAYRIAVYDVAQVKYPGSYAANSSASTPATLSAPVGQVAAKSMQICGYIQPMNSHGNVTLAFASGAPVYDVAAPMPAVAHGLTTSASAMTCTAGNLNAAGAAGIASAAYAPATESAATGPIAPTPPSPPGPAETPVPTVSGTSASMCIANTLYTNNVLPAGVGEFATNGLDRGFWGGTKSRTESPVASWGPGFFPSWGRHQYDTYFSDSSDGLGIDPFSVTADTAVAGSPQALRIMAAPLPSNLTNSLTVLANDQWVVTHASTSFEVPANGGKLVVDVANPNSAQNGWKVGMGYAGGAITFIGTLTSGGATPSGNGTGGSNPWTISNIHLYSGTPGTVVVPGDNDEGGLRSYNIPAYYSGALDANVNLRYGFFVARLRLPDYLPALSPAFWTLETGGVPSNASGLQRDELDIEEMFGNTSGNSLNAGDILWNTPTFWPTPTGVYNFPNGTPQSAYHDYGVLVAPGSTTFYLDGQPISAHSGGPDWTQGSPDKEIMLMFQIGAPGTWLDKSSQGMSNPWPQYLWAQWLRVYQPTKTSCTS